jgi:hypothetical protein
MKILFEKIIPKSKIGGVISVVAVAGLLLISLFQLAGSKWGQGWADNFFLYGLAIFCGVPFFVGVLTAITIGYHNQTTRLENIGYSLLALLGVGVVLLFFAVEGLICLVMAFPIVAIFTIIGSLLGYYLRKISPHKNTNVFSSFFLFLLLTPSVSVIENHAAAERELTPVTTSIVIDAAPEKVWKNVVEFPELAPPKELLFKTGVAYPIRARIDGEGKGAIRYCEFSTGAFVEPITIWDENRLLQFSVNEQPLPMRELTPYGDLDTPHLHDYFVSRKGQFKLTQLENGGTLLEGTTWYYHRISPEFYWRIWTEKIVHTIHQRVLNHIKEQSESN